MKSSVPSTYQKSLVAFLYFIQGVFLVIPGTMILTYKQIPSYDILALFSFATLPFSFKFMAAPLIEKYTIPSYGRRKTWVVVSLILATIILNFATAFTQQSADHQTKLAICLTFAIFMVALEDISTDALAVKELKSSQAASFMQCVWQPIGGVAGSLIFLELVSGSLYIKLGFSQPFLSVNQYFRATSALILLTVLFIHFTYKQTVNEEQKQQANQSLWQVVKNYRYFTNPKYSFCRQGIVFLIQHHGLTYFSCSFAVELIKSNKISKDVLTTISNMLVIPVYFLTTVLRKYWSDISLVHKRTRIIIATRLAIMMLLFFSNFQNSLILYTFITILSIFSNLQFFLTSLICNNFTESKYAGMFVTMMASFTNFGNNSTIQLQVINKVGRENAVYFGFCISIIVILSFGFLEAWIKSGMKQTEQKKLSQSQKEA